MDDILSNFIYWWNSSILLLTDGIKIPQNTLFLHTFSWDLKLFSVLKQLRHFKQ